MRYSKIKHHFKQVDPQIFAVMRELDFDEWLEPKSRSRSEHGYFVALCREIVGQQLSSKAARAIYAKFVGLFERNSVEPKQILTLENQVLRDAGLSWAKVSYIKDLAVKVLSQELALETLAEFEDKKVIEALTTVKGVGPWTAEMFLIFTLGRENVFSYGDLGLKRGMESVYGLKDPSIEQMEQIVTPWSPFKSYGSIALWHALE